MILDSAVTDVDLVDLGANPGGPVFPIAVSAGASGAGGKLTSWTVREVVC